MKLRTGNASRHGAWLWCPREQEHHRHPYFARNLSRSFFETPQKRCNSNDANSMFEQAAGELRAKLMGGGGAWPGFKATRRAKLAARTASGRAAAHGAARPHRCEGRRRDLPRCRWVAAGPGRASRSTTPSRRLACGDLAGGPPPTGTHSGRAPQSSPAPQTGPPAPGTPAGPQATTRENKNRRPRRICGFIVREGGVEPPLHHWNTDLNRARLPIPPLARTQKE